MAKRNVWTKETLANEELRTKSQIEDKKLGEELKGAVDDRMLKQYQLILERMRVGKASPPQIKFVRKHPELGELSLTPPGRRG
ncbi:MAG: hypothetical protein WAV40_00650 [Microgenomates group bacterium]